MRWFKVYCSSYGLVYGWILFFRCAHFPNKSWEHKEMDKCEVVTYISIFDFAWKERKQDQKAYKRGAKMRMWGYEHVKVWIWHGVKMWTKEEKVQRFTSILHISICWICLVFFACILYLHVQGVSYNMCTVHSSMGTARKKKKIGQWFLMHCDLIPIKGLGL